MRFTQQLLRLSALAASLGIPAVHATDVFAAGAYAVSVTSNVPYGPLPPQKLDVYRPVGLAGAGPAFVMIHGGGMHTGDKTDTFNVQNAQRLAGEGYTVFNINYRLINDFGQPVPDPYAANVFPAALEDTQLAVRWVRRHAAEYQVHPGKICSWGDSAGGNLAVFVGALQSRFPGDMAGVLPLYQPGVNCVVDISGGTDLQAEMAFNPSGGTADYVNSVAPAALRAASPLSYVNPQSAPMSIIQGANDTTVDPISATELNSALESMGVPSNYMPNKGGHVLQGIPLATQVYILRNAESWALSNAR